MANCILFFLGLVILWVGVKAKAADEIHRLALTSAALIPIGWGYFSSPFLFQCLSGLAILWVYQMYVSYS